MTSFQLIRAAFLAALVAASWIAPATAQSDPDDDDGPPPPSNYDRPPPPDDDRFRPFDDGRFRPPPRRRFRADDEDECRIVRRPVYDDDGNIVGYRPHRVCG